MKNHVTITEAEWPVMEVLWNCETATAAEIVQQVAPIRGISMRTVKTFLRKLVAKEAVGYFVDSADSRIYHYNALISREESQSKRNETLLNTVYGGKVNALLVRFIGDSDLSGEDIENLKKLLEEKKASLPD